MPDSLMQRVKAVSVSRKTSFRALVIEALEKSLAQSESSFELPDASAGKAKKKPQVTASQVNAEIDQLREGAFRG